MEIGKIVISSSSSYSSTGRSVDHDSHTILLPSPMHDKITSVLRNLVM